MGIYILLTDGVGCLDIELSEEPNLGQWSVSTRLILVKIIAVYLVTLCIHAKALANHGAIYRVSLPYLPTVSVLCSECC